MSQFGKSWNPLPLSCVPNTSSSPSWPHIPDHYRLRKILKRYSRVHIKDDDCTLDRVPFKSFTPGNTPPDNPSIWLGTMCSLITRPLLLSNMSKKLTLGVLLSGISRIKCFMAFRMDTGRRGVAQLKGRTKRDFGPQGIWTLFLVLLFRNNQDPPSPTPHCKGIFVAIRLVWAWYM